MKRNFDEFMVRDWEEDDAQSIARYANNRKVWLCLRDAFPNPYSLGDARSFLARVMSQTPRTSFAIANEAEAIGCIGITPGQDIHRFTAEIGYWLAEPFWGDGIMTEAVKAVCEYGFEEFGLCRIFAEPYATNLASARVLEKAGFAREGVLRASAFKDGKVLDQLSYAKLREGMK
jgi:[ribosomal protein S5]-alanine N-acetyltransferase